MSQKINSRLQKGLGGIFWDASGLEAIGKCGGIQLVRYLTVLSKLNHCSSSVCSTRVFLPSKATFGFKRGEEYWKYPLKYTKNGYHWGSKIKKFPPFGPGRSTRLRGSQKTIKIPRTPGGYKRSLYTLHPPYKAFWFCKMSLADIVRTIFYFFIAFLAIWGHFVLIETYFLFFDFFVWIKMKDLGKYMISSRELKNQIFKSFS